MRQAVLVLAAVAGPAFAAAPAGAEYFCSPGFEPSYGGTCVAVLSRAEVVQYIDQPLYAEQAPVVVERPVRRHHRRNGLRERF